MANFGHESCMTSHMPVWELQDGVFGVSFKRLLRQIPLPIAYLVLHHLMFSRNPGVLVDALNQDWDVSQQERIGQDEQNVRIMIHST